MDNRFLKWLLAFYISLAVGCQSDRVRSFFRGKEPSREETNLARALDRIDYGPIQKASEYMHGLFKYLPEKIFVVDFGMDQQVGLMYVILDAREEHRLDTILYRGFEKPDANSVVPEVSRFLSENSYLEAADALSNSTLSLMKTEDMFLDGLRLDGGDLLMSDGVDKEPLVVRSSGEAGEQYVLVTQGNLRHIDSLRLVKPHLEQMVISYLVENVKGLTKERFSHRGMIDKDTYSHGGILCIDKGKDKHYTVVSVREERGEESLLLATYMGSNKKLEAYVNGCIANGDFKLGVDALNSSDFPRNIFSNVGDNRFLPGRGDKVGIGKKPIIDLGDGSKFNVDVVSEYIPYLIDTYVALQNLN